MGEYGWLIWTGGETAVLYLAEAKNISEEFRDLLAFTKLHECEWLRLDRDAETIDGLPTFEW
jgi:hypothetical protein